MWYYESNISYTRLGGFKQLTIIKIKSPDVNFSERNKKIRSRIVSFDYKYL